MNPLKFEDWSERQQVLAIIVVASMLLFALWYFLLLPQNRRRHRLRAEISRMENQLQQKNYFLGREILREERNEVQRAGEALMNEWDKTAARLATFSDQHRLEGSDVGHIDYKVALFDVRSRLLRKARQAHIGLPPGLGMEEAVTSNEDARKLMLQLRAVEKIVDIGLDLQINLIDRIRTLPPIEHAIEAVAQTYLEEYPVRIEFYGTLDHLYKMLQAILKHEQVFAVRNLRAETPDRTKPDVLRFRATLSALVFVNSPEDLLGAIPAEATRPRVAGH